MKAKEIRQKRIDQVNADSAEGNRRTRGYSKGWEKKAEEKMEPWRKLENPDEGGLAGKTYLHSGVTSREYSRTPKEQIRRLNLADPLVISKDSEGKIKKKIGRITKKGRQQRKDLRKVIKERSEAEAQGLTQYEVKQGKGKKNKRKKSKTGLLEMQGY